MLVAASLAALFTGLNMFQFPQFESDEGTYMGSAWAMVKEGQLSYYTYNYDHPPLGWLLIGGWATLVGGFLAFGTAVATGRVFMWIVAILSTVLVYALVRRATARRTPAFLSAVLFAVSPLGVDLHRQVWLDNVATLFLLLSIYLLVTATGNMTRILMSAVTFGLSFWSKEIMVVFLPGMAALAIAQAHPAHRRFAASLWAGAATSVMSLFVLLAVLKDELLPPGVLWSSTSAHVSLVETYQWQMSRRGGGPFDPESDFARHILDWMRIDPLVAIAGAAAVVIGAIMFRRDAVLGSVSILALSFVFFLGRGGQVLFYYVIPLFALLVVAIGLLVGRLATALPLQRIVRRPLALALVVISVVVTVGAADAKAGTFRGDRTSAQRQAADWIVETLPRDSMILMDSYAWVDVREASVVGGRPFLNAHYYWPGLSDPAVRTGLLHDNWRNIDYVALSPSMEADVLRRVLPLLPDALRNSDVIASFSSQDWGVRVLRIRKFEPLAAREDPMLANAWSSYKARFLEDGRVVNPKDGRVTTSEGQAYALMQAIYMDDRATFDRVWDWTRAHLQVRGDGLFAWRWGARPARPLPTGEPDPAYASGLAALAQRWSAELLGRPSLEGEVAWMVAQRIPATDAHVSAYYEQIRDGTVWSVDPATFRAVRARFEGIWSTLAAGSPAAASPVPVDLVAHAISEGWAEDRVREAFLARLRGAPTPLTGSPMTVLDWNSATDADEDIALALLFASRQWDDGVYLQAARGVLDGIWEHETAVAGGRRVIVAGNWAQGGWSPEVPDPVLNPSYFAPYAYRIFAEVDPARPWRDLIDSSYDVLTRIHEAPDLGRAGLVPNWVQLDATTGAPGRVDVIGESARRSSYDASRVYWRLALDWLWSKDDRARRAMDAFAFPRERLKDGGTLLAGYNLDGTPAELHESLSMYAATLATTLFDPDPALVHRVFAQRILGRYVADGARSHWGADPDDYYDQNWAWFATALMNGAITNVWADQPPIRLDEAR